MIARHLNGDDGVQGALILFVETDRLNPKGPVAFQPFELVFDLLNKGGVLALSDRKSVV